MPPHLGFLFATTRIFTFHAVFSWALLVAPVVSATAAVLLLSVLDSENFCLFSARCVRSVHCFHSGGRPVGQSSRLNRRPSQPDRNWTRGLRSHPRSNIPPCSSLQCLDLRYWKEPGPSGFMGRCRGKPLVSPSFSHSMRTVQPHIQLLILRAK